MEERKALMRMLRHQVDAVFSTVQELDKLGVEVKLSVILPADTRDGCQGISGITLNKYNLTVDGKFEEAI